MQLNDYVNEIKLELTGGLLELEITDETIASLVTKAFREIQRYIDIPKLITVPFASCIDLDGWRHNSIVLYHRNVFANMNLFFFYFISITLVSDLI